MKKKKQQVVKQSVWSALIVILILGIVFFVHQHQAKVADSWYKIKTNKKIVIGIDDTFAPYGYRDTKGKLAGIDVELAKATFKRLGITPKFQTITWSMKETELKTGKIDAIWNGYTLTKERQEKVAFSIPYYRSSQVLVTMTSSGITTAKGMVGQTLGSQSGSSALDLYKQKPTNLKQYIDKKVVEYDTFDKALDDLQVNRVNGVLISETYARYYISHQSNPKDYRIIDLGYPKDNTAVGLRKEDHLLRQNINRVLKKEQQDGTIDKIINKYLGSDQ